MSGLFFFRYYLIFLLGWPRFLFKELLFVFLIDNYDGFPVSFLVLSLDAAFKWPSVVIILTAHHFSPLDPVVMSVADVCICAMCSLGILELQESLASYGLSV